MKALDRTGVIRQSVSVFIDGIAGFIPIIGIIPATAAVIRGFRIRRAYSDVNPVDHYRKWGMALAGLSILVNFCAVVIAVINLTQAHQRVFVDYGSMD